MPDLSFPLAPYNGSAIATAISGMAPATFPIVAMFGDSRCAGGNYSGSASSVTLNGTIATVTFANHSLNAGFPFFIDGCAVDGVYDLTGQLNGAHLVTTRTSVNVFTFPCTLTGTVTASPNISVLNDWRITDRNLFTLGMARLGQGPLIVNRGCSGQTTASMLARVQRDIANLKVGNTRLNPTIVFLRSPGINDINASVAIATIQSNIAAIITQLLALPTKPLIIISTCLPVSSSNGNYSASRRDIRLQLNQWIRNTYRRVASVLVFDEHGLAVDTTGAEASSAGWIAAYTDDGLHENATFNVFASSAFSTFISPYFPGGSTYGVDSTADNLAVNANALQILPNPLLTGSAGTIGSGGAGTAATGLNIIAFGTATWIATAGVTRTDGVGFDQKIAIVNLANNDGALCIFANPNILAGNNYQMKVHFKATNTVSLHYINLYTDLVDATGDNYISAMSPNGGAGGWPDGSYDMLFTSPIFNLGTLTLSATATRVDIIHSGAGGDATHNLYFFGRMSTDIIT